MKPNHFATLLVVAVVSFAVAVAAYVTTQPWTISRGKMEAMLPALKASGDKIAAVEIEQGGKTLKLTQSDGKWVIPSQENYPANVDAIRKLVVSASEASLVERKTAKEDRLKLLGLADPKAKGSTARLIRFLDANGAPVGEIIVGNKKADAFGASKSGTYVRRPGETQTWLADRALEGTADLRDWTKTRVVDMPTETVKKASIEVTDEPAYEIVRDSDGKSFKLSQIPNGKKLKYVNSIDEIIESASYVDFQNVRKAKPSDTMKSAGKAIFETDKGLKVELDLRSDGKEAWVSITPSGEGAAKTDADAMSALVKGWEFEIPTGKVTSLMKKQADLLEDTGS
jgi:hypothetical protein